MASCTKIEHSLQSFIDGELSDSERVIMDNHLHDCASCQLLLKQHKQCNAEIFENLAIHKYTGDMSTYVMEHLPELISTAFGDRDLERVNFRTKHPYRFSDTVKKLAPIAATLVIVGLAYVLKENWPEGVVPEKALGIVTAEEGRVYKVDAVTDERVAARLKTFAMSGDRFETDSDARAMITLLGPTEVKLGANSRILIHSDRRISVEKGRVFLDVAKAGRIFRVLTPNGTVTVFGTSFEVKVLNHETTVSVAEGEVQIEQGDLFKQIYPGEQVRVTQDIQFIKAEPFDVAELLHWSGKIAADADAQNYFVSKVAAGFVPDMVQAERVYRVDADNYAINYLELVWEPTEIDEAMGYHVYVYSDQDELMFTGVVNASKLAKTNDSMIRIYNKSNPEMLTPYAFVKIVADTPGHEGDLNFLNCSANLVK